VRVFTNKRRAKVCRTRAQRAGAAVVSTPMRPATELIENASLRTELVDTLPIVGRLTTVVAWRREIAKCYREARLGQLAPEALTRLVYACSMGAKLCATEQELREARAARLELARRGIGVPPARSFADLNLVSMP
jgi:hypothetical protein